SPDWKWKDHASVPPLRRNRMEKLDMLLWHHISDALAVIGNEGVPINKPANTVWHSVSKPGNDHAAITVANKYDFSKVVLQQMLDNRLDGFSQSDSLRVAHAVTHSRRCEHLVARDPYRLRYGFEFLSGVPRSVNQDINAHVISSFFKVKVHRTDPNETLGGAANQSFPSSPRVRTARLGRAILPRWAPSHGLAWRAR